MKNIGSCLSVLSLLFVVLLVAACDSTGAAQVSSSPTVGQTTGSPGIRRSSEILTAGPSFTNDKGNSVTVVLDTKIPVICAAAYGATPSYGHLASDPTMAGSAITHHQPLLWVSARYRVPPSHAGCRPGWYCLPEQGLYIPHGKTSARSRQTGGPEPGSLERRGSRLVV